MYDRTARPYSATLQGSVMDFMYKVYGWMAAALAITAGVAYYVSTQPKIYMTILTKPFLLIGLIVAQLALVIGISFFINRLSYGVALVLFFVYAATLGLTLSAIFVAYSMGSIVTTFAVTAGMFGVMAIYGYVTGSDLTSMGNISIMILWGIILAMLVNMYFKNPTVELILSIVGVIVFALLTAYDSQKIKMMGQQLLGDKEMSDKASVLGALTLYLDFINLFLFLLRFMGRRNE